MGDIGERSGTTVVHAFDSFDALLQGQFDTRIATDELESLALKHGRVLLQGPAGSGKSTLLLRFVEGVSDRVSAKYIDAADLSPLERAWRSPDDADEWIWSQVGSDVTTPRILCLDSLDAIPIEESQQLLNAVESVTNTVSTFSVVLADRLARREIREDRWLLLGLTNQANSDAMGWRDRPYFATLARKFGPRETPAQLIAQQVGAALSDAQVPVVATAAMEAWMADGRSAMERSWLSDRIGHDVVRNLERHDLLRESSDQRVAFAHLLIHGYLAAHALREREDDWDKAHFEGLTLRSANFESLGMLLTMVDQARVDDLVRRVDSWNFYAAAYLLAEDEATSELTSPWLVSALLLLLGRRRFSPVPSTRIQVEDSLRMHKSPFAQAVLDATGPDALIELASALHYDEPWWHRWLAVFSVRLGDVAPAEVAEAINSADDVVAWTAANVLTQSTINRQVRDQIVKTAEEGPHDDARWRAVHVLGHTSDSVALEHLLRIFEEDSSEWVRNGALRSAVLVASAVDNPADRKKFFTRLAERSEDFLTKPKWLREIERSTRLDPAPPDWPDAVGVLLEALWANSQSVEQQDRWRRLSASLRTQWSGSSKLGRL